jgi:hypothetical protein
MASLPKKLRNQLARVALAARAKAEEAALAALENLAVHERDPRTHMSPDQRQLRNRLRARGRALGDSLDPGKGTQEIARLVELVAYENWHRMLFTRFLTANGLLISDDSMGNVPVTLDDCEELASSMGARDGFDLACRFASQTLPGVFRKDDPALEVTLAPNDRVALRELLDSLDDVIFQADDSLGWTYQFWQAQRKDEVNDSGTKIGADELPAVTQLFTEDYMVDFLLDNTLGAWWAGKTLSAGPSIAASVDTEDDLRKAVSLPGVPWAYMRFIKDDGSSWRPAAGTFDGWPKTAKELTCLDPCMGSGHFVVAMFARLVPMRMREEGLSETAAIQAVIRDNLYGLEIDPRCTQIGAFNLALAAWRRVGYCSLPAMRIACSGLSPNATEEEWVRLAEGNPKLEEGMRRLHGLFKDAPVLGSLINPREGGFAAFEASFAELQPILEKALAKEDSDDAKHEMAVTARGVATAAEILGRQFTLVATNVPYLGRPDQGEVLRNYCETAHRDGKADLAAAFLQRCAWVTARGGVVSVVTPQSWLTQPGYKSLRKSILTNSAVRLLARLGPRAFATISGERVNVCLVVLEVVAEADTAIHGVDASSNRGVASKIEALHSAPMSLAAQSAMRADSDHRLVVGLASGAKTLGEYASCVQGLATSDDPQFTCLFWEFGRIDCGWEGLMGTVEKTCAAGGRERLIHWEDGRGRYFLHAQALKAEGRLGGWKSGTEARGKRGVLVSQMSLMPATLYTGEFYDHNASVLVPNSVDQLPAIWAYASSDEFRVEVRKLDSGLKPSNGVFTKIPFDQERWARVASSSAKSGTPPLVTTDPTQWLFNGHPKGSNSPLHVAVARLVGYHWPRQTGSEFPDCPALGLDGLERLADEDGIVCLRALNKEQPAVARLRNMLAAALGSYSEATLLAETEAKAKSLEDWLRDEFFEQHCKLFHNRPFIWHVWDGRKDGFAALVNYHRLDHNTLKKLTYSYLGDWIRQQQDDVQDDKAGAAERLGAAQELQAELAAILEGEAPYDIFVRWKPLSQQAIGWHPDLNDGVRLNIRPFLMAQDVGKKGAGVLRSKPNIKWDKDRGKEPKRDKADFPWFWCEAEPEQDTAGEREFAGHRWNDVHLSLVHKRATRK